jgi:soluble lytic murein transglycosylase-like protein
LLKKYNSVVIVLACYNAGEGNVIKWKNLSNANGEFKIENIPFKETANYVKRVLKVYNFLASGENSLTNKITVNTSRSRIKAL